MSQVRLFLLLLCVLALHTSFPTSVRAQTQWKKGELIIMEEDTNNINDTSGGGKAEGGPTNVDGVALVKAKAYFTQGRSSHCITSSKSSQGAKFRQILYRPAQYLPISPFTVRATGDYFGSGGGSEKTYEDGKDGINQGGYSFYGHSYGTDSETYSDFCLGTQAQSIQPMYTHTYHVSLSVGNFYTVWSQSAQAVLDLGYAEFHLKADSYGDMSTGWAEDMLGDTGTFVEAEGNYSCVNQSKLVIAEPTP